MSRELHTMSSREDTCPHHVIGVSKNMHRRAAAKQTYGWLYAAPCLSEYVGLALSSRFAAYAATSLFSSSSRTDTAQFVSRDQVHGSSVR